MEPIGNCKSCGKLNKLEYCADCNLLYLSKWMSEDNGKDVLKRIERKIDDLGEEIELMKEVLNVILPKSKKLNKHEWEDKIIW